MNSLNRRGRRAIRSKKKEIKNCLMKGEVKWEWMQGIAGDMKQEKEVWRSK